MRKGGRDARKVRASTHWEHVTFVSPHPLTPSPRVGEGEPESCTLSQAWRGAWG
jgi:hypothetical protein